MFKPKLGFILLFVENPKRSAQFYRDILSSEPIEESPTFAMFALEGGVMFGLWSRYTAEPTISAAPGCSEIAFSVDDVDAIYESWGQQGITMAQKPTDMDFGRAFVALDPDGHRIRVYRLHEGS